VKRRDECVPSSESVFESLLERQKDVREGHGAWSSGRQEKTERWDQRGWQERVKKNAGFVPRVVLMCFIIYLFSLTKR
jgi:hypothetical protein